MEKKIEIKIVGPIGIGKTTIAQEIVDMLRDRGFDVKWDVGPDYKKEDEVRKDGMERLNALESVSERTPITVSEVDTKNDINESLNYRVKKYRG
jgi:tRNA uridine 5-carbamoylmethylation protein Kti12